MAGTHNTQAEELHPAQRGVPQAVKSRVPMGLWAHVWEAHLSWLATVDGYTSRYSSWCSICHEGGDVLLCNEGGCGAVQHAACSMQGDSKARHWRCDDCWLMAGERPAEGSRRVGTSSGSQDHHPTTKTAAKRKRLGTASRPGWVMGARVLDACGVEHSIEAMQRTWICAM